jgi:class 3 adenylate cyclase/putative methionine-R-sulfoxide reductase with GAF domain
MQRRGESRPAVTRQRASRPKTGKASIAHVSTADLQKQLDERARELDEALQQQSATSEVLRVISRSPTELQSVLNMVGENAARLCDANNAVIYRLEGNMVRQIASYGGIPTTSHPSEGLPVSRDTVTGRAVCDHQTIHVHNLASEDREYPVGSKHAKRDGHRTTLATPLLREGVPIGAILIRRMEVRPFSDKQIALLETFAAQAVIAIENARLLNELRQRTDDLTESLEQQTATSEVLRVISSSPGELEPVFQAMLENARRICEAEFGVLYRCEGELLRVVAMHGAPQAFVEERRRNPLIRPPPQTALGRSMATKQSVQIADIVNEPHYFDAPPGYSAVVLVKLSGARTVLAVPMLKENELIGAIVIWRTEVRPFSDKQIELVKNFAAQAVIAIENTRLLNELRQHTGDLSEALEQQTATSEVLKIIASSPGNLEPVFIKMLGSATRICEAKFGTLFLYDGNTFRVAAGVGTPPELAEFERLRGPFRPELGSRLERIVGTKQVIHIVDDAAEGVPSPPTRLAGARSIVAVPMVKDDVLIGAITIYRQEVRPFTDKQIALLINFAAQAVIAIENTRLLNDLNKLNQQLEQRVTDQVSEIERMGRLRRFLPPQVADLIVASGTEKQLEGHRQEVTALFCDLRGFTGFSESSDPEDVMALLAEYHAAIGKIIIKYSGTLERYAGDGVMVIFNDPVPVENPALQAVLMALDMRAAIGSLIEKWRELGHDLGFGIGIAHGFATLGTIGFEGRRDYAAIGTVSNVASRLCDEAKPGQILISPRVRQAVDKGVTVEAVGEFALKGIRRPMTAYNVLEASLSKSS